MMKWLIVALLLVGCSVDEVAPLLGTQAPVDGGMAGSARDGAVPVREPAAVMAGERVLIYEPSADPRRVLQGGSVDIAATEAGVMIAFKQNIAGRVVLSALPLTNDGEILGEVLQLTSEDQRVANEAIAAHADEVAVFYSDRAGTITMLRLHPLGQPLGAPVDVLSNVANNATLQLAVPTARGYAVAWLDDRASTYTYVPYVARVDARHGSVGAQLRVQYALRPSSSRSIGALVADSDGLSMIWTERSAGGPDHVYRSSVAESAIQPAVEMYSSQAAIGGSTVGLGDAGLVTAIWDVSDDGIYILRTAPDGQPQPGQRLSLGTQMKRPLIGHAGGSTMGLVASAGALRPTNPLATELHFVLLDALTNVVHSQIHLNADSAQDRCIEDVAMTKLTGQQAFGVVWTEGCSERRMYFARVNFAL